MVHHPMWGLYSSALYGALRKGTHSEDGRSVNLCTLSLVRLTLTFEIGIGRAVREYTRGTHRWRRTYLSGRRYSEARTYGSAWKSESAKKCTRFSS